MTKLWKQNGTEQKFLENLFKSHEVNGEMRPSSVQSKYELFKRFTATVFRKHWQLTKKLFETEVDYNRGNDRSSFYDIEEIEGVQAPPFKIPKIEEDSIINSSTDIAFAQPPLHVSTCTDPETKQDRCIVLVLMFGGVSKAVFDIVTSNDKQLLKIQYEWPKVMFDPINLFRDDIQKSIYNPKRIAVEQSLEKVRNNIEDVPNSFIELKLSVLVMTEPSTWTKTFKKQKDGNVVLYFEFFVTPKDYATKKSEKSLLLT